jgi:anti-anti-sigma factor
VSVESFPVRWDGHQVIVGLPDEIDIINSDATRAALDQALAQRPGVLVADMTATTFCASEGLRILLHAHFQAVEAGSQFRVAAPGPIVRRVMELTATDQVLDLYPSLDAALASDTGQASEAGQRGLKADGGA